MSFIDPKLKELLHERCQTYDTEITKLGYYFEDQFRDPQIVMSLSSEERQLLGKIYNSFHTAAGMMTLIRMYLNADK